VRADGLNVYTGDAVLLGAAVATADG
jgi:hypothetical protein